MFVRVALNVPVHTLFDYKAASATKDDIGRRVLVPLGTKIAVGVIMDVVHASAVPASRMRSVITVLRDIAPLPQDVRSLLEFCSEYYHHPLGEAVFGALPARLRRRNATVPAPSYRFRLTQVGSTLDPTTLPTGAVLQRELLSYLQKAPDPVAAPMLRTFSKRASAAIKVMIAKGWVETVADHASNHPDRGDARRAAPAPYLSLEQQDAVAAIRRTYGTFAPWLLLGVTGSGKTEVYLELMGDVLGRGEQILLLVPEINLTPQLEARVGERFPAAQVVALHSGLNDSERLHNWLCAQSGAADIVIGTRLAVFAPIPRLGLIVVDEEHDSSFKQFEGLRYSARDIALLRAKMRTIPAVLGSATPALETFHQTQMGRHGLLTLTSRINADLPAIECVDIRGAQLIDGLAQPLLAAVRENLHRGEQSLIYINRRGYAPVLYCAGCGWTSECQRCAAKLVLHLKDQRLRCHHCGHQEKVPATCPQCGAADLAPIGQGTQRIESALARIFSSARIVRVDRDSVRRKDAWSNMRRRIHANEVDILVGTQILAKGHDFPELTLVGVINADSSLYSCDFRAAERLYAGLTQVAGRAGRASHPGRVLIQTEFPGHPLYQALRKHDYRAFAHELLEERQTAGFPPYAHQAVLRAEAPQLDTASCFLARAARLAHGIEAPVTIYDVVSASMPRLAGLHRAQLTVQSGSRAALQRFLRAWHQRLTELAERRVRWALDVDPQEL